MKILARLLVLAVAFGINLPACHSGDGGSMSKASQKGGLKMTTYYVGRFSIDVPAEMKQAVQAQSIRHAEITEFVWPQREPREKERLIQWNSRLREISMLEKPDDIKNTIIAQRELELGGWSKGVCYYGDYIIPERHFWSILVDYGTIGIWLTIDGTDDELSMKNFLNILKNYRYESGVSKGDFHLKHGAIALPYLEQEKSYVRFEGHPLQIVLKLEMKETYEARKTGMAARLAASIATRYAPGVDVRQIRSHKRTLSGLDGEELVTRMSARGEETNIYFFWKFDGEVDSGDRPEVRITMETPDGSLEEKMRVWDAVLNSFRAPRT